MQSNSYFVTGLCLQGNKGGPAIALALTSALKQHMPDAKFVFSVPGGKAFEYEKIWAERYGYQIVENIDIKHLVPPFSISSRRVRRLWRWIRTLRSARAMIQMSAISYVGPPSANPKLRNLLSGRFMDFYMARFCRRPMLAWTQSYGPLTTPVIRFLAALDLKRQPIVFCRGDDCMSAVNKFLPGAELRSYPDIAISLPFNAVWAKEYLNANDFPHQKFVSISPSAVIYSKSHQGMGCNGHIEHLKKICSDLTSRGFDVVIVPHTFRPENHDPNLCDFGVCLELNRHLAGCRGVYLIKEDLSPIELKSIISLASFHIGARYHSVVAALSSGVPAISLSWHPKYKDLMRVYGMEDFVINGTDVCPSALIDKLLAIREQLISDVANSHKRVVVQSQQNIAEFVSLLRGVA